MKALLILALTVMSSSVFAANMEITCANNSNSDLQMTIFATGEASNPMNIQVTDVALYNVDWAQTAEGHTVAVIGQYLNNDINFDVRLADGQYLQVPQSVFDKGHDGNIYLNSNDTYHCF